MRALKVLLVLVVAAVIGLAGWLYVAPPDLIRVGSGYSAKIVCSNAFLTDRDPRNVLRVDVQAPGHWLLRYMNVSVDRATGVVRAGLFGLFGKGVAVYREGLGCATVPDGDIDTVRAQPVPEPGQVAAPGGGLWPAGEDVAPVTNEELDAALNDPALAGPGMRAIVVVRDGRIVAERYGDGFDAGTRLLGWSMTKSVASAIVGRLIRERGWEVEELQLHRGRLDEVFRDITAAQQALS